MRSWILLMVAVGCSRGLGVEKDIGVASGDSGESDLCNSIDDACIQEACEACVESCGTECYSMDIYPMEYSCSDGHWTVYDVCPDWSFGDTAEE